MDAGNTPVTRAELEQVNAKIEAVRNEMKTAVQEAQAVSEATNALVKDIHTALFEVQPGHKTSLLDRMARVTIQFESGDRVAHWIIRGAMLLGAVGAILAFWRAERG